MISNFSFPPEIFKNNSLKYTHVVQKYTHVVQKYTHVVQKYTHVVQKVRKFYSP